VRSLPPFVFACLQALALVADLSGALAARHWAASLGVALALRSLGGALLALHPGLGKPEQRGPAVVALLGAGLFYGGVLGPRAFPGTRHLADAAAAAAAALRLPLPAAGPLASREGVDAAARAAGLLGAAATAVASLPALFEWRLVGAHEGARDEARAGGGGAAPARPAAAPPDAAAAAAAAAVGANDEGLPSARAAAGPGGEGARRRAAAAT